MTSMNAQQKIGDCLAQIQRIATTLVPDKNWHTIHIDGYIVGSTTEVKSWYILPGSEVRTEYETFDLDYINEDNYNNEIGNFVEQIRGITYDVAKGAWYTISIEFHKTGVRPAVRYNYEDLPAFEVPVPLNAYKKDLKVYPRPEKLIPEWLR